MVLDLTQARDRVRLAVADTNDLPVLSNDVYDYLLSKYTNNETAATKEAAYLILGQLSFNTRERLDRIETYGNMAFDQYLKFIGEVIKNPNGYLNMAGIYAGGVDKADFIANNEDQTVIQNKFPTYNSYDDYEYDPDKLKF